MRIKSLFPLLLSCLAAGANAALPDAQRAVLEAGVRNGALHDVAVGWIDHGERGTAFFGSATADSRFEIGTLTETLTGVLLAQAAFEGKLRLHHTLSDRLADVALAPGLKSVTLESLATHRAGLPLLPPNLFPDDIEDPYANYGERDLRAWLARGESDSGSGYSPLDFGVLGFVLARSYGAADFGSLLHDKVLVPLALAHTGFDDDGVLGGHSAGGAAPHWHFAALSGGAGVRSSLGDLLGFAQANLKPEDSPLRAALLLARQPRDGDRALGWNITQSGSEDQVWPVLWRASVSAGHAAFLGFRTDRQQALVLLCDDDVDLSALGMSWLADRAVPVAPIARAPRTGSPNAAEYVGLYQVRNGSEIIVREHDGKLTAQLVGEPAATLSSLGDDIFDAGPDAFTLTFQREGTRVSSVLFSRGGVNGVAERLSERSPLLARAPLEIPAAQWDELAGDYRLGSATMLRIARRGDAASVQLTGRGRIGVFAYARDRYRCEDASCELRVRRDESGKIVALEFDLAGGVRVATRIAPAAP